MPKVHANEAIRLTDHLDPETGDVRSLECHSCQVVGPAVVAFDGTTRIIRPTWETFDGGLDALLWEVDPNTRPKFLGALEVVDSLFEDCTFVQIGVVVTPTGAHNFASGITVR